MSSENLHHDENTLTRVLNALRRSGLTTEQAMAAIHEMQNSSILFREYARDPQQSPKAQAVETASRWRPIDGQGNIGTEPALENPPDPEPVGGQDDGETGPPEAQG